MRHLGTQEGGGQGGQGRLSDLFATPAQVLLIVAILEVSELRRLIACCRDEWNMEPLVEVKAAPPGCCGVSCHLGSRSSDPTC